VEFDKDTSVLYECEVPGRARRKTAGTSHSAH
jgi:hypothetical protein